MVEKLSLRSGRMKSGIIISMLFFQRISFSFRSPLCWEFFISVSPRVWRVAAHFHQDHLQSFLHVLNVSSLWFPSGILSLPTSHWPLWSFNFYPSLWLSSQVWDLSFRFIFVLSSLTPPHPSPFLHLCVSLVSTTFQRFFKTFPFHHVPLGPF